jgi:hypothetical protein
MTAKQPLMNHDEGTEKNTNNDHRLLWGILLIVGGLFFLVQNLGFFGFLGFIPETLWTLFWMGAFGITGLAFLAGLLLNTKNWWMAIPGFALLGLSGTIAASEIFTFIPFVGSIFLSSIGLGFLVVYIINREMWWALIPGGVLSTLAVVAALDSVRGITMDTGVVFFLGLGLTFALVGLVPTPGGRMYWAWIPAGVMLVLALTILTSMEGLLNILWPLVLVGVGVWLLFRNLVRHNRT